MSDLSPLTEAGVLGAAVAYVGKLALEVVRQQRGVHSIPPTAHAQMPGQVDDIHEIVTTRDADGVPRVLNKPSVERAILETAAHASRQTALLEDIADTLAGQRSKLPTLPGE